MRSLLTVSLFAALAAPLAARATVTLSYVGAPYQNVSNTGVLQPPTPPGPYTRTMLVSAAFVVEDPLSANLVGSEINFLSFKISDGLNVYTNGDSKAYLKLWTDAEGDITNWSFYEFSKPTPIVPGKTVWRSIGSNDYKDNLGKLRQGDFADDKLCGSTSRDTACAFGGKTANSWSISASSDDSGEWRAAATPTPEPATWVMVMLGAAMIGFAVRHRREGAAFAA